LQLLSRPRRPRRASEWTNGRAVTFIVTLAASRSVTLAARAAGMSRKSAYALKGRDPTFAAAWATAVEGDKVEEVDEPPIPTGQGNKSPSRGDRERGFAQLLAALRDSAPLAPCAGAQ
jgi:hypothetical protein